MFKGKTASFTTPVLLAASALSATPVLAQDHVPMSGPINRMDPQKPGTPGPRTCFWTNGPYSGDPYLNIAWPDTNTFYWTAKFTVPEGATLRLDGQFPHARYSSFTTYDMRGQPVESLADYLISPLSGHTNPAREGADRTARKRSYSIDVEAGGTRDLSRREGVFIKVRPLSLSTPPKMRAIKGL